MTAISIPTQRLETVCEAFHIQRLMLFGSVLRADFGPDSDIDMLVEFKADTRTGLFELSALKRALEDIFERSIDLGTPSGLSKYIRDGVLESAQVIYEQS